MCNVLFLVFDVFETIHFFEDIFQCYVISLNLLRIAIRKSPFIVELLPHINPSVFYQALYLQLLDLVIVNPDNF